VLSKRQRVIIGQTVKRLRRKARLSQESLAEKAGIHPNYVGRIERGECSATLAILLKLAKVLKVRPYKIFLQL